MKKQAKSAYYLEEQPYTNLTEYLNNLENYTKRSRYRIEKYKSVELDEGIKELMKKYADSEKYKVEVPEEVKGYYYSQEIPDELYKNRSKLQDYSKRKDALIDYQNVEIYKLAYAVSVMEEKLKQTIGDRSYEIFMENLAKIMSDDLHAKGIDSNPENLYSFCCNPEEA